MKEIKKEQIVQLREHDLNRGHNKSQTPVYPKTIAAAVEGLEDIGRGITEVTELPETGEEGKIYYNTTDKNYYTYNSNEAKFTMLGNSDIPIVVLDIDKNDRYEIESNIYYILQGFATGINSPVIRLTDFSYNVGKQYFGRFTAQIDNQPFEFEVDRGTVYIPDEDAEIEILANHTYEFNILLDIILLKDITWSLQTGG